MKNPFKDNSLASFLMGAIIGVGGCVGYYSITEPEYPTNPQGQIAGIMGTPVAGNDNQQQNNFEENTQTQSSGQTDENTPTAKNENAEIIHTKWYDGEKFHGLADNPGGNVRVTPAGKKYHRPSCPHIEGHEFISATESDAEKVGLTPCKKCKP